MRRVFLASVVAITVLASAASAVEVTFTLKTTYRDQNGGWFDLLVDVSPDDNAGLAGYDVEVLGIDTFEHFPPAGRIGGVTPWTGMNIGSGSELAEGKLFAGQNTLAPDRLVYGLAQHGVTPIWPDPGFPLDNPVGWYGHLVTGTYIGPTGPTFGNDANATVFVEDGSVDTIGNISFPPSPIAPADFDWDGNVDDSDFWMWASCFDCAPGETDADSDGDTDGTDFLIWQAMYPTENYDGSGLDGPVVVNLVERLSYAADFGGDGRVDGDDFLMWQQGGVHFPGGPFIGDADRDGDADGDDFLLWQAQFGLGVGGAASGAVPEPTAWLLALLAWGATAIRVRKR